MARGPVEVGAACESALAELAAATATSDVVGSREEWAAVLGAAQRVIDVASAVQDAAMVRLAAIEPEWLDDGTEVESNRALGHAALDAPAIVSGVLVISANSAANRVRTALHLAADGPAGSETETGLGALHAAMMAGRLDAYRAGVVADELEHAPAPVRASVVAALDAHFDTEDAAHLRRRCRRVLARISPDLLRQRAARARAESGLRRWADEPGVDHWDGTFPSEEAAAAWAAIDELARRYVADGVCAGIERARAKALTDLVAGNATVTTVLTVTVPATALPSTEPQPRPEVVPDRAHACAPETSGAPAASSDVGDDGFVEVTGPAAGQPVLVSRQWVADTAETAITEVVPCDPASGALVDPDSAGDAARDTPVGAGPYRPPASMARRIRARDRRCRFPGCTVAAVFCDLDHARPWPHGPTTDTNLFCLCRRHHRIKQRPGWRLTLRPDGTATWTDPTGRVRTTAPVDALSSTVLSGRRDAPALQVSTSRARTVLADGPHSELEFLIEHLVAPARDAVGRLGPERRPLTTWRHRSGRQGRVELSPRQKGLALDGTTGCRRRPGRKRPDEPELPPF